MLHGTFLKDSKSVHQEKSIEYHSKSIVRQKDLLVSNLKIILGTNDITSNKQQLYAFKEIEFIKLIE